MLGPGQGNYTHLHGELGHLGTSEELLDPTSGHFLCHPQLQARQSIAAAGWSASVVHGIAGQRWQVP